MEVTPNSQSTSVWVVCAQASILCRPTPSLPFKLQHSFPSTNSSTDHYASTKMADNQPAPAQLDLTQILATLASLPKPHNQDTQPEPQQQVYDPSQPPLQVNQSFDPSNFNQPPTSHTRPPSKDPRLAGRTITSQLHNSSARPQQRSSTPTIDPATITEWKHGLRCVSKVAERNSAFSSSIQKVRMIEKVNFT